jgi:hypothetical protein
MNIYDKAIKILEEKGVIFSKSEYDFVNFTFVYAKKEHELSVLYRFISRHSEKPKSIKQLEKELETLFGVMGKIEVVE